MITCVVPDSPERVPSPETVGAAGGADLFGNDDLFPTSNKQSRKSTAKSSLLNGADDDDNDIFSSKTIDFPKTKVKSEDLDDMFSKPKPSETVSSIMVVPPPLDDDDDDLFSSATLSKPSTKSSVINNDNTQSKKAATKTIAKTNYIDDDDDDIFSVKKSKPKPDPSPIIEDDDDIFASSSLKKSSETKSASKVSLNGAVDDNIFADSKPATGVY